MTKEKELQFVPEIIQVRFGIGGEFINEKYNLFNPSDIACWKANNSLTAAIQLGVKVLKEIEATDENLKKLKEAREKAEFLFTQIKKDKP